MNSKNNIIKKAEKSIEEEYNKIMLQNLSEKLRINQYSLCRLFKKINGKTFCQYRTNVRIRKSMDLLQYSEKQIKEIAYDVGYSNPNYFSHVFKKILGITPSQFRKNQRIKVAI